MCVLIKTTLKKEPLRKRWPHLGLLPRMLGAITLFYFVTGRFWLDGRLDGLPRGQVATSTSFFYFVKI